MPPPKTSNIHARISPEVKSKLEAIRLHHAQAGEFTSLTQILEGLIEREHKKLKLK